MSTSVNFTDQKLIIIGGSSGMGFAVAQQAALPGAHHS